MSYLDESSHRARFQEIRYSTGKKYLRYFCEKCRKFHITSTSSITFGKLNSQNRNGTLYLWCGRGEKPKATEENGLSVVLAITHRLSKSKRKHLGNMVVSARSKIYFVGAPYIEEDDGGVQEMLREKRKRLSRLEEVLETSRKKLDEIEKKCLDNGVIPVSSSSSSSD